MIKRRAGFAIMVAALVLPTLAVTGCEHKGAAQRAGEKIDDAKDKAADTINPKGPAEKAGRKVDRAVDDIKK